MELRLETLAPPQSQKRAPRRRGGRLVVVLAADRPA